MKYELIKQEGSAKRARVTTVHAMTLAAFPPVIFDPLTPRLPSATPTIYMSVRETIWSTAWAASTNL